MCWSIDILKIEKFIVLIVLEEITENELFIDNCKCRYIYICAILNPSLGKMVFPKWRKRT
jgi:hypothetical protein